MCLATLEISDLRQGQGAVPPPGQGLGQRQGQGVEPWARARARGCASTRARAGAMARVVQGQWAMGWVMGKGTGLNASHQREEEAEVLQEGAVPCGSSGHVSTPKHGGGDARHMGHPLWTPEGPSALSTSGTVWLYPPEITRLRGFTCKANKPSRGLNPRPPTGLLAKAGAEPMSAYLRTPFGA